MGSVKYQTGVIDAGVGIASRMDNPLAAAHLSKGALGAAVCRAPQEQAQHPSRRRL